MADDHLKRPKASQAELEASIAATQLALKEKLEAIKLEVRDDVDSVRGRVDQAKGRLNGLKSSLNVPARVDTDPFKMVGLSLLGGAAVGGLIARRQRRRERPAVPRQRATKGAGPAALIGFALSVLRPALTKVATDFVTRRSAERSGRQDFEVARTGSGSALREGSVFHDF